MGILAAIALGGALGALCRYAVSNWLQHAAGAGALPVGTLGVNVIGAFLLGFIVAFVPERTGAPAWIAFAGIGFLGSFTTFSTFSLETMNLVRSGLARIALIYVALNVLGACAGVVAGEWLGRRL